MLHKLEIVKGSVINNERLCVSTTEPFVFTQAMTCQRKDGIEFNLMLSVSISSCQVSAATERRWCRSNSCVGATE